MMPNYTYNLEKEFELLKIVIIVFKVATRLMGENTIINNFSITMNY